MALRYYKCGHNYLANSLDSVFNISKQILLKWRYSVGCKGDKTLCLNCYIRKLYKV
jgi:hypothetical protein